MHRSGRAATVAFIAVLLGAVPASAQAPPEFGVSAGEITSTSAILWTRAPQTGPVTLTWGPASRPAANSRTLTAVAGRDQTVQTRVGRLRPGTAYKYVFRQQTWRSDAGSFRTAPRKSDGRKVRFAFSGDADAQPAAPGGAPFYNGFESYGRMAAERNHFNINLGDTIYSDTEVGARFENGRFISPAPALTLQEKWGKYKQNFALEPLQRLRGSAGLYSHWDDHEFINDYAPEVGYAQVAYPAGVQAFRDYAPVTYTPSNGLYRTFRWGRNLELFFLDERSFRSAKASPACLNPANNAPDLAPTAPKTLRDTFAQLIPSLSQPVAAQCLATLNAPARTMLGSAQLNRFLREVKRSKATFKAIVNETPLMKLYALPYDRWEGYAAEREKLLKALQKVPGVVVLTTDMHASIIGEIRLRTLEAAPPVGTGIWEVIAGPVATATFAKEIDQVAGFQGAATTLRNLFYMSPPPGGLGLACVELDTYSYAQVDVTGKRLTVTPKDATGKRLCDPLVVKARKPRRR